MSWLQRLKRTQIRKYTAFLVLFWVSLTTTHCFQHPFLGYDPALVLHKGALWFYKVLVALECHLQQRVSVTLKDSDCHQTQPCPIQPLLLVEQNDECTLGWQAHFLYLPKTPDEKNKHEAHLGLYSKQHVSFYRLLCAKDGPRWRELEPDPALLFKISFFS